MALIERAALSVLQRLDPETAHDMALGALTHPLVARLIARPGPVTSPRLATRLAGMDLPNPLGLAAGFDKNAVALAPLSAAGFGFLEVGAATPRPQPGNPRPRLFRLRRDRAVINRFGFNNDGAEAIAARLAQRPASVPVGLNLGANKDSADRAGDYVSVLRTCGPHVDFVTVNVSSPNTAGLRDLQGRAALWALLTGVLDARAGMSRPLPVFLKIAPDLDPAGLEDIARVALDSSLDGIIATNTTLARPDSLQGRDRAEAGGLSGAPLFAPSTRVLARLAQLTEGRIALVGVGGISSAEEAYAKIRAGAHALQLYSALVYHGLGRAADIARGLDALLARDGFANVAEAVGCDTASWFD